MSNREGTLRMQSSGRWAICRPGCDPFEITSGDEFRVEVDGELKLTRMEYRHFEGPLRGREFRGAPGEYYSVDGYELRGVLRAAIGAEDLSGTDAEEVAVVDILEAEDHLCATCLFDAIIDLIAMDELVDGMSEC
jgi:hypothetical protein